MVPISNNLGEMEPKRHDKLHQYELMTDWPTHILKATSQTAVFKLLGLDDLKIEFILSTIC